jgi:hypothetical protein
MKSLYLSVFLVPILISCQNAEVHQKEETFTRKVFRSTTLTTFQGTTEIPGTKTKIWYQESQQLNGDIIAFSRSFLNDASIGYHKKSLPNELAYRNTITAELSQSRVLRVEGFAAFFKKSLPNLNLPKAFETELKLNYSPRHQRKLFSLWRKSSVLPEGSYLPKQNITQDLKAQLSDKLWQVDSVIVDEVQKVEDRSCVKWDVFYKMKLPQNQYLFEQMGAADTTAQKEFIDFKWKSATAKGRKSIYSDLETGRLCREVNWQEQHNIVTHKETGEAKEFASNLFTEVLYTYE